MESIPSNGMKLTNQNYCLFDVHQRISKVDKGLLNDYEFYLKFYATSVKKNKHQLTVSRIQPMYVM